MVVIARTDLAPLWLRKFGQFQFPQISLFYFLHDPLISQILHLCNSIGMEV